MEDAHRSGSPSSSFEEPLSFTALSLSNQSPVATSRSNQTTSPAAQTEKEFSFSDDDDEISSDIDALVAEFKTPNTPIEIEWDYGNHQAVELPAGKS